MSDNVTAPAEFERLRKARESPAPRRVFSDGNGEEVDALRFLRWRLRLSVASVAKLGVDLDADFDLKLDDGEVIRLGTAADVLMQNRARAAIMATTGHVCARLKPGDWDQVAAAIAQTAVVVNTHATADSETRGWVAAFARAAGTHIDEHDREQFADALDDEYACRALSGDEHIWIQISGFSEWINRSRRDQISPSQLAKRLVRLGFTNRREQVRRPDGTQARRRLWRSPAGFDPAADPGDGDGDGDGDTP